MNGTSIRKRGNRTTKVKESFGSNDDRNSNVYNKQSKIPKTEKDICCQFKNNVTTEVAVRNLKENKKQTGLANHTREDTLTANHSTKGRVRQTTNDKFKEIKSSSTRNRANNSNNLSNNSSDDLLEEIVMKKKKLSEMGNDALATKEKKMMLNEESNTKMTISKWKKNRNDISDTSDDEVLKQTKSKDAKTTKKAITESYDKRNIHKKTDKNKIQNKHESLHSSKKELSTLNLNKHRTKDSTNSDSTEEYVQKKRSDCKFPHISEKHSTKVVAEINATNSDLSNKELRKTSIRKLLINTTTITAAHSTSESSESEDDNVKNNTSISKSKLPYKSAVNKTATKIVSVEDSTDSSSSDEELANASINKHLINTTKVTAAHSTSDSSDSEDDNVKNNSFSKSKLPYKSAVNKTLTKVFSVKDSTDSSSSVDEVAHASINKPVINSTKVTAADSTSDSSDSEDVIVKNNTSFSKSKFPRKSTANRTSTKVVLAVDSGDSSSSDEELSQISISKPVINSTMIPVVVSSSDSSDSENCDIKNYTSVSKSKLSQISAVNKPFTKLANVINPSDSDSSVVKLPKTYISKSILNTSNAKLTVLNSCSSDKINFKGIANSLHVSALINPSPSSVISSSKKLVKDKNIITKCQIADSSLSESDNEIRLNNHSVTVPFDSSHPSSSNTFSPPESVGNGLCGVSPIHYKLSTPLVNNTTSDDAQCSLVNISGLNDYSSVKESTPTPSTDKKPKKRQSSPFRRITNVDENLVKKIGFNSFSAKKGDHSWGEKAFKSFQHTRGKAFRHEKTKKKKGSYRGGTIDMGVNSILFESD